MKQHFNPKVTLTCQISPNWQQKIEKIAADRHKSSEEIVSEAIALYLGEASVNSSDRLLALEGEVAVLKQMLSQLNTTVTLLQQQQAIAKTDLQFKTNSTPPLPFPQPLIDSSFEEEIEDEPDEILYDFLEGN
ncbi:MAG: hypothetical protein J7647_12645 [Cyanobacteria bacterium SBLK]|nr:hypothetical protein [Cyanobacteria bacterium SBLK]